MSDNLKWSCHVSHIYNVASMCAFLVLHSFSSKNIWTLLKAYTTYVRPKLEYNIVVWRPFLQKNINLVESVQQRFTRLNCIRCKISFNSYSDRLSKLNIDLLKYRRLELDLILMFKMCHSLCDLNFYEFLNFAKLDTIYVNILLELNICFILNMSSIVTFSSIALLIYGTIFPKVS